MNENGWIEVDEFSENNRRRRDIFFPEFDPVRMVYIGPSRFGVPFSTIPQ
jgi:hypothetical protein